MIRDLVKHIETETGLSHTKARAVIGIVFNAADRQGSPMAEEVMTTLPGARTLAAKIGEEIGASTSEVARLIEKTPGGRRYVRTQMIRSLHSIGLGHDVIGKFLPALSSFMRDQFGHEGFATIGDLFGSDDIASVANTEAVAA